MPSTVLYSVPPASAVLASMPSDSVLAAARSSRGPSSPRPMPRNSPSYDVMVSRPGTAIEATAGSLTATLCELTRDQPAGSAVHSLLAVRDGGAIALEGLDQRRDREIAAPFAFGIGGDVDCSSECGPGGLVSAPDVAYAWTHAMAGTARFAAAAAPGLLARTAGDAGGRRRGPGWAFRPVFGTASAGLHRSITSRTHPPHTLPS